MIYRLLGGVGLLLCALAAIWFYGNAREKNGVLKASARYERELSAERVKFSEKARATERQYAAIKDKSDADYDTLLAEFRARSVRAYARTGTNVPQLTYSPEVIDGPDNSAVVAGDRDICTEFAARLVNAQEWAATLKDTK